MDASHNYGLYKVAVAAPPVEIANPSFNSQQIIRLGCEASANGAKVVVFPEMALTSYSLGDFVQQQLLHFEVIKKILDICKATDELNTLIVFGAPLCLQNGLYNCGVLTYRGKIQGVVPKCYIPNYREFEEKRYFCSGYQTERTSITIENQTVPFGAHMLFQLRSQQNFILGIEICEDLWSPIPPSTIMTLAGATIVANLSASNSALGKEEKRKLLCRSQSERCTCAYLYTSTGEGESTTDVTWKSQSMIFDSGACLVENISKHQPCEILYADIDIESIHQKRMRMQTFPTAEKEYRFSKQCRTIIIDDTHHKNSDPIVLCRQPEKFPFLQKPDGYTSERYVQEIQSIQIHGLAQRMRSIPTDKIIIGVSGGIDSAYALLIAVRTMEYLGFPTTNILAFYLPSYGSSEQTRRIAFNLMESLKVTKKEIDITESCNNELRNIDHPAAKANTVQPHHYDRTYENVQAGIRASTLFRLANLHNGIALGTSDLSELALGWCTYGVGDHMSHYSINANIPKTLIQYIIWYESQKQAMDDADIYRKTLASILELDITPELIPNGQKTEEIIGPYVLHDFFLYYTLSSGFAPRKIIWLAQQAWCRDATYQDTTYRDTAKFSGKKQDNFGDFYKEDAHYCERDIKFWMVVFLKKFFQLSQFKRSAMPDGPKVFENIGLSPRNMWKAPSDSQAEMWLAEIENIE